MRVKTPELRRSAITLYPIAQIRFSRIFLSVSFANPKRKGMRIRSEEDDEEGGKSWASPPTADDTSESPETHMLKEADERAGMSFRLSPTIATGPCLTPTSSSMRALSIGFCPDQTHSGEIPTVPASLRAEAIVSPVIKPTLSPWERRLATVRGHC
ncbi:hypothetical protein K432DRAFT_184921 [Lepidopterella palustris CBS 459.81]|uniref:Uncharacterized protein n=1 Tax=Lepidopterella palustris CBS 459.81 TaxID=1314670 RepID=A0A8E2EGI6_9PEZI|nr:hypothetical protein K432DRAFT_184921 [Lepidopterella palustris CBS 459.81]